MTDATPVWRPDGWGAVARVGLLVPHADVGPESEIQAMAPPGIVVHAARAPFGAMAAGGAMDPTIADAPVRAFAEPPGIDDAVDLLAAAPVGAIGYAFTSSAYLIGAGGEAAMLARLRERAGNVPVTAACTAAAEALGALGVRRLALVHPPWFDAALAERGAALFGDQGFEVVSSARADLPSDQRRVEPAALYDWLVATRARRGRGRLHRRQRLPRRRRDRGGRGRARPAGGHGQPGTALGAAAAGRRPRPSSRLRTPLRGGRLGAAPHDGEQADDGQDDDDDDQDGPEHGSGSLTWDG